jgi:hypothetical protein
VGEATEAEEGGVTMTMADENTIDLDCLVGAHLLDGVDDGVEGYGSASAFSFRLDGVVYTAVEDEDDGYRSSLDRIIVQPDDTAIKNAFPAVQVVARISHGEPRLLEIIDCVTGKTVIEVGTDDSDDYYPSFRSSFWPENMAVNKGAQ